MEEENYNAIGGGSEELEYPTMDEQREDNDNPVLAQLNEMSRRSCKRRYEELENLPPDEVYTHPIDWHMRMPLTLEEREAKRQKQLEEEIIVERVTTKIIDARMRKRTEKHGDDMIVDDLELETRNKVMRIPPIDGTPWMGVSTDDNDHRYYIRLLRNSQKTSDAILKKRNTVLFTERMFPNIIEDSEKVRKIMLERLTDSEHTIFPTTSDGLWVDNYSPKSFVDLLSDDEINRNVLTWLKLWDECVFRKKISNEDMDTLVMEKDKEIFALDSGKIRRPTHKVLLLSGPAGLGKTTLAKIIAHHAGYDTVEVNASDSRNVADFERVIEGALRSTKTIDGTVGGGGRPNCLILDEIDGAPAETIRYLVRTLQVVGKKCIRRPIICICNNMFTPSLRELRNKNVALSIPLSQPKQDRMVDRLMKITEKENVRIDRGTLIKLVELCNRDVRCSINIMQFVAVAARKEQRVVGLREIQEAVTKQSLGSTNIFESWSAFLDLNKHLDSKGIQVKCSDRVRAIERIMYECGDERFVTGLHANFVRLSLPIGVLRKASECFVFYDKISITIGHLQNYVLNRYMLSFYAMFHLTVATHSRIAIKYPHYEQEIQQRLRQSQETISAVRSKSMAKFTPFELISDILPLIGVIVQPPLKPMNEHLYSKREIAQIQSTVSILYWYNLTFVATVVGSQVHYTFQPPIDVLTLYDLSDVNGRQSMPSSTRYMLAKKVEVYRVQANQGGAITSTEVTTNTEKIKSLIANSKSIGGSRVVPLHFKYNQGVLSGAFLPIVQIGHLLMGEVILRKQEILSKIEYACIHLIKQLLFSDDRPPKVLTLRVSDDESSKQNHYRIRNMKKLAFNICTLSQIYRLISCNLHSTKRDLYYDLKSMYKVQSNIDRSITTICELLNESRIALHVLSCSKGIISGDLCFVTSDESLIDCKAQPLLLYESLTECRVISSAEFILIVEKDATFQKLVDENFFKFFPKSILVTGKGYPDICTRQVLLWLIKQLKIPIFGLFDADPHGMEIMLTYKYGAMDEKAESKGAFLPSLEWIGLLPSDSQLFPVAENQRLPLVNKDFVKIGRLRRRAELLGENEVVRQCDVLREMRFKLELEAISSITSQFLARIYLQPKIKEALNRLPV